MKPKSIKFDNEKMTLLLEVGFERFDLSKLEPIALKDGFSKKDELHITIIGFRLGAKVKEFLDSLGYQERQEKLNELKEAIDLADWDFNLLPYIYRIRKEEKESYIQMLDLPAINNFFRKLNGILGLDITPPPIHVTLFTKNDVEGEIKGIGISSQADLLRARPIPLEVNFSKIILPVRPQADTIIAIFMLKNLSAGVLPGIEKATIEFWTSLPEGRTAEQYFNEGVLILDQGSWIFDHHGKEDTTLTDLVMYYLGIHDDPALAKLLEYARRDDLQGKGTISQDPIDKAFGLSGLIAASNKSFPSEPNKVIDAITPVISAHYQEEKRRVEEFPKEVESKKSDGKFIEWIAKLKAKKLKIVMVESNNIGLPGYLRSAMGGGYDVVVQQSDKGFVNIMTRALKRVDLRPLAALIRIREAEKKDIDLKHSISSIMAEGRINEIEDWYYDHATNSLLNGGSNPSAEVNPTEITWPEMKKIVELAFSEDFIERMRTVR